MACWNSSRCCRFFAMMKADAIARRFSASINTPPQLQAPGPPNVSRTTAKKKREVAVL